MYDDNDCEMCDRKFVGQLAGKQYIDALDHRAQSTSARHAIESSFPNALQISTWTTRDIESLYSVRHMRSKVHYAALSKSSHEYSK
jgi:hypothetical protein